MFSRKISITPFDKRLVTLNYKRRHFLKDLFIWPNNSAKRTWECFYNVCCEEVYAKQIAIKLDSCRLKSKINKNLKRSKRWKGKIKNNLWIIGFFTTMWRKNPKVLPCKDLALYSPALMQRVRPVSVLARTQTLRPDPPTEPGKTYVRFASFYYYYYHHIYFGTP